MEAVPDARRGPMPTLAWLLIALSAGICVLWFAHALGYWEDDAWIHLEFARSLAAGHGFRFNGNIVYGGTSPLWVFLLITFHTIVPNWIAAGKALTAAAAVFSLTGAFFFSRSLVRDPLTPAAASIFADDGFGLRRKPLFRFLGLFRYGGPCRRGSCSHAATGDELL